MKKCSFCAKEISYDEMYCCDECQKSANDFYEMRDKNQSAFSALNGVFVIGIGICIFLYAFLPAVAVVAGSICLMILGLMYFFLPFPAEVMIEKYKLKKAMNITRAISMVLFAIGAVLLVLHFIGIL